MLKSHMPGSKCRARSAWLTLGATLIACAPPAWGQLAVFDAASVRQLVAQVSALHEQLATTRAHLAQAREQLESMRGERGMQALLAGTSRNYLPPDWQVVQQLLDSSAGDVVPGGAYAALGASLRSTIETNAVLSSGQLAMLAPWGRQHIESTRRSGALLQVLAQEGLASASGRFAAIQQLIDAIPAAHDQKAILDLQARIAAEQGMLENEQTKLQLLYWSAQAERQAELLRAREQALAGHGRFESRFQPRPW